MGGAGRHHHRCRSDDLDLQEEIRWHMFQGLFCLAELTGSETVFSGDVYDLLRVMYILLALMLGVLLFICARLK